MKLILIYIIELFFNLFSKYVCSKIECHKVYDCFNCVVNPHCKWDNNINICDNYNESSPYAIKVPNNTEDKYDEEIMSEFLLFIKNACYKSYKPYYSNYNNYTYNEMSNKYCGQHLIPIDDNTTIKLNKIDDSYGFPNIVCEYLFEYCPGGYDAIINIKENYINNITLFYHHDSQIESKILIKNPSSEIHLFTGINTLAFTYYSPMTFYEVPFEIKIIKRKEEKTSQTMGILLLIFIIISLILIVSCIIYIRKTSKILRPDTLEYSSDEKENIMSTNIMLKKQESIENPIIGDNKIVINPKIIKDQNNKNDSLNNLNNSQNLSNNNTDTQFIKNVCPVDNKNFLN